MCVPARGPLVLFGGLHDMTADLLAGFQGLIDTFRGGKSGAVGK